ncbi:hypothetical protein HZS_1308 [Henneguya salminicola]|nr:hypothetical protein HZS_1308 [Henneguya salminicola]
MQKRINQMLILNLEGPYRLILVGTSIQFLGGCNSRSFKIFLSNIRQIYNPYSIVSFHELPNLNRNESFFLPTHDDPMVFSFFIIKLKQTKFNKNTLSE